MFSWFRRVPSPLTEKKCRVMEALTDYPPYSPPRWNPDPAALREANIEYSAFFFDNLGERKEALRTLLAKFNVLLDFDETGIMAVSTWHAEYADLLVDDTKSENTWFAYHRFDAPWIGPLIGLNPIFDLGVYMGECLLLRNPRLRWNVLRVPDGGIAGHSIIGQRSRRPFDPMKWTYMQCENIRDAKRAKALRLPAHPGQIFTKGTYLYGVIQSQTIA